MSKNSNTMSAEQFEQLAAEFLQSALTSDEIQLEDSVEKFRSAAEKIEDNMPEEVKDKTEELINWLKKQEGSPEDGDGGPTPVGKVIKKLRVINSRNKDRLELRRRIAHTIGRAGEELEKLKAKVQSRRNEWLTNTRKNIESKLREIIGLTGHVTMELTIKDDTSHLHSIHLVVSPAPANVQNDDSPPVKEGGSLNFYQEYNGKIAVWISFSFVADRAERKEVALLKHCEPSELTEEGIAGIFLEFILKMVEWRENIQIAPLREGH